MVNITDLQTPGAYYFKYENEYVKLLQLVDDGGDFTLEPFGVNYNPRYVKFRRLFDSKVTHDYTDKYDVTIMDKEYSIVSSKNVFECTIDELSDFIQLCIIWIKFNDLSILENRDYSQLSSVNIGKLDYKLFDKRIDSTNYWPIEITDDYAQVLVNTKDVILIKKESPSPDKFKETFVEYIKVMPSCSYRKGMPQEFYIFAYDGYSDMVESSDFSRHYLILNKLVHSLFKIDLNGYCKKVRHQLEKVI